jgi:hypothetical protein
MERPLIVSAAIVFWLASAQSFAATLPTWMQQRREAQLKEALRINAFHNFQFSDHWESSQIRFEQRAVEDANKRFKGVHYDHGAGVAIADVDGDGRLDLFFVGQLGGSELWRNIGGGKFEKISVFLPDRVGVAAAFADIDNDGDPDLFVTTVRGGNALFENIGNGQFRDITQSAGLEYVGHSSGIVFFDFDNDGLLDLYVCNVGRYTTEQKGPGGYHVGLPDAFKGHLFPDRYEPGILYRNLGNRKFQNVSSNAGLEPKGWSGDASFADLNNDGLPDLYILNMQGDDHYFENVGGGKFAERTASYFPKTPWGAMGIKFFDVNQDGRVDLLLTDMHSDMTDPQIKESKSNFDPKFEKSKSEAWCTASWSEEYLQGSSNNIFGNALYLNRGSPPLVESSQKMGAETFWPWGLSTGDLNADGYEDVFVTAGMGFGFRYAINSLLLNEQGERFYDAEFICGIEPRAGNRLEKVAFQLDASGADRNHPLAAGRSGIVPVFEACSSRSSVIFDLDDDGDLDIVTNEMNDRPMVLVSNASEKRQLHWLKVRLSGSRSNREGLGALVKVHAGGKTWSQRYDGKLGYLAQSSAPLYFGLAEATTIEKVEVEWPSGAKQIVTEGLRPNELLKIIEP